MLQTTIFGYTIKSLLGEGGMGRVFYCEHEIIKAKAVVKVLNEKWSNNDKLKERFIREATILAKLKHPNIVRLLNYGIHPELGQIILMDFVEGRTLGELLQHEGRYGIAGERIRKIFRSLLDAFSYAHSQGIVHRDIKPENIIIDNDDNPIVLDFGIAKIIDNDFTVFSQVLGTPSYMSPEQVINSKVIDKRSDIYSLGVLLYLMIEGKLPYKDCDSQFSLMNAIINQPIPALTAYGETSINKLNTLIQKATAKHVEDRYTNCEEFKDEFEQIDFVTINLRNEIKYDDNNSNTLPMFGYDEIRPFSCGRAAVRKGHRWGFIDSDGNVICESIYESVSNFSNGHAWVTLSITALTWNIININGDKIGYIDSDMFIRKEEYHIINYAKNIVTGRYCFLPLPKRSDFEEYFPDDYDFCLKKANNFFYLKRNNSFFIYILEKNTNYQSNELIQSITVIKQSDGSCKTTINNSSINYTEPLFRICSICGIEKKCDSSTGIEIEKCEKFCYWNIEGFKEEYDKFELNHLQGKKLKDKYSEILYSWMDYIWNNKEID